MSGVSRATRGAGLNRLLTTTTSDRTVRAIGLWKRRPILKINGLTESHRLGVGIWAAEGGARVGTVNVASGSRIQHSQ